MRETAGSAAAPAARCRNCRRGSFIAQPSQRMNGSLRLDVEGPDDVAPLLCLVGDKLAEVGGRPDERRATQIGEPRLDLMIGENGVDLLVELLDNLCRRGLRCTDAGPGARLVARHKFSDRRLVP